MTFKVQKTENTGVVYADPSDPGLTVRLKHAAGTKSLSGKQVTNQVTEIIINDDAEVTIAGDSVVDAVSIRLRVSGTLQSHDRKVALLNALSATLALWSDEDVLQGFNPASAPVSPV